MGVHRFIIPRFSQFLCSCKLVQRHLSLPKYGSNPKTQVIKNAKIPGSVLDLPLLSRMHLNAMVTWSARMHLISQKSLQEHASQIVTLLRPWGLARPFSQGCFWERSSKEIKYVFSIFRIDKQPWWLVFFGLELYLGNERWRQNLPNPALIEADIPLEKAPKLSMFCKNTASRVGQFQHHPTCVQSTCQNFIRNTSRTSKIL